MSVSKVLKVVGLPLVAFQLATAQPGGASTQKIKNIMEQRLTFITIGAKNLDSLKHFYTDKFKWTPIKDDQGIVFFKLNGFIFALYPADELAKDANTADGSKGFKNYTLAVNYRSETEVDGVFVELKRRGVTVVKPPQKAFWGGYSGYVSDSEGNLWEIAFNPFLEMDADGNVLSHK